MAWPLRNSDRSTREEAEARGEPGVVYVAAGRYADAADLGGESVAGEVVSAGYDDSGGECTVDAAAAAAAAAATIAAAGGGGGGCDGGDGGVPQVVAVEIQSGNHIKIFEESVKQIEQSSA